MNYKSIFLSLLLSIPFILAQGQTASSDSIKIVKKAGVTFVQNKRVLKPAELLTIMKPNPEAYNLMKKAKGSRDTGSIIGSIGGFMVGWSVGRLIAGGDVNWGLMLAGGGLIGVSIPFGVSYNANAIKAVNIYNNDLIPPPMDGAMLEPGIYPDGLGVRLTF